MRILRLAIIIPLLLLLVLFLLSNSAALKLGLWPTDYTVTLPASLVILGAMAVAFLAGAFLVWVSEVSRRRRARQAEQAVAVLEEQVKALKAQLSRPGAAGG
jgi:uncharacterized integral membrane protein